MGKMAPGMVEPFLTQTHETVPGQLRTVVEEPSSTMVSPGHGVREGPAIRGVMAHVLQSLKATEAVLVSAHTNPEGGGSQLTVTA